MIDALRELIKHNAQTAAAVLSSMGTHPQVFYIMNDSNAVGLMPVRITSREEEVGLEETLHTLVHEGIAKGLVFIRMERVGTLVRDRHGRALCEVESDDESKKREVLALTATCPEGDLEMLIHIDRTPSGRAVIANAEELCDMPAGASHRLFCTLWNGRRSW